MANIGIVGWGVVGQATGQGFATKHKVLWHDPYKKGGTVLEELVRASEFIFVCVPTPMFSDHSGIDLSIVEDVVYNVAPKIRGTEKVLIIKSSVVPGTTARLAKVYSGVHFVVNPEFLTDANAAWDFMHPARTIIGAFSEKVAERVRILYDAVYSPESIYFLTDPTSAELAKYMSNLMLAAKVVLANEFYALSQALSVDYDKIRQMVEVDSRIGSHLKVPGPDGDFGFGAKCFPKDMVALLGLGRGLGVDVSVLEAVWEKNLKIRKVRDWERISGAVTPDIPSNVQL